MIVLLLFCLKSYAQPKIDSIPSTGKELFSDTTVTISIDYIRLANAKMIERNFLIKVTNQQDSIIAMKNRYIEEQSKIIIDFKDRVKIANSINEAIKNDLEKQQRKNKILTYGGGGVIVGLIIGLIAK